ncbi:low specificity L-threonine aldolase [Eubacteriales bacterium OttesenSCG-928-N13]|nr:low specificity L-threonine aldolase [Eubacteriales bacterium OttesenSCG-928-N13]
MNCIDMRSDTVTQPTQAMRDAMYTAVVGDDVYEDDPTVIELEQLAARMVGKQAALFVPSGTMGNQLGVMTHVPRGGEVILGAESHIMEHEVGAAAVLSGAFMRALPFPKGVPTVAMVQKAIRQEDIHYPETSLICVEQPLSNGRLVPLETLRKIKHMAEQQFIPVHMDGARIFNAATAMGVDASEIAACADSVMFCLSKGLCAPVGSMLAGSREFVLRARKNRKLLGGGMRQAGFLAAAGLIALKDMTKRLDEDHQNARYLADGLKKLPGVKIDPKAVEINMVFFSLDRSEEFVDALPAKLLERGIKINGQDQGMLRLVTNNDIGIEQIDALLGALAELLA